MASVNRRIKEVRAVIERLGFVCESITQSKKHLHCAVIDKHGNHFKAFTGITPSCPHALQNFRQDLRRLSYRARGKIDD